MISLVVLAPQFLPPDAAQRLPAAMAELEVTVVPYKLYDGGKLSRAERSEPQLSNADWDRIAGADVVVALELPDGLLSRAPALRWVQAIGAGTDHLPLDEMALRGIVVTNASGVAAGSIAEFVIGRLLQECKSFRQLDRFQQEKRWQAQHGDRLAGRTIGIVGLGAIGRATARLARAFQMRVVATRRSAHRDDNDPDVDRLFAADDLDLMLCECDILVICAPAGPQTDGLIAAPQLAALKRGAILCNVARGSLLDEAALIAALNSEQLSAAILDVVQTEPLTATSPLWTAANCYLSAHTATSHVGYPEALLELLSRNLRHFASGDDLENTVSAR